MARTTKRICSKRRNDSIGKPWKYTVVLRERKIRVKWQFRLTACFWIIWLNRESVRVKRKETSSSPVHDSFVRSEFLSHDPCGFTFVVIAPISVRDTRRRILAAPSKLHACNSRERLRAKRRDSWINSFKCFVRYVPESQHWSIVRNSWAKFATPRSRTFAERFWQIANRAASTTRSKPALISLINGFV